MLKPLAILCLIFLCAFNVRAQVNLVPNGSFEILDTCPDTYGQFSYLQHWFSPTTGSPDIFNTCAGSNNSGPGVPDNGPGYQNPEDGLGYVGIATCLGDTQNYREYIAVKLDSALVKNKFYCFTMYCSIFDAFYDEYIQGGSSLSVTTSSTIGVYFSSDSTFQNSYTLLPFLPQIQNPETNPINDFDDWTKVEGVFKSVTGTEQYIYIGNFNNNSNTQLDTLYGGLFGNATPWVYFYIDDISLVECEGVGIDENTTQGINIYPNPAQENVIVTLPKGINKAQLFIYGTQGQLLRQENINSLQAINIGNLTNGLYFFVVQNNSNIISREKIVIAH